MSSTADATYAYTLFSAMKLRQNCYRLRDREGDYFFKIYERASVLNKVWKVHKELGAIDFPYIQPISVDWDEGTLRQRWIDGIPANYRNAAHRLQVYEMLQALHATNKWIDWQGQGFNTLQLKKKWQARLAKFKAYESIIRPFLQYDFDLIVQWAEEALREIEDGDVFGEPTLLHGDVVHHNFFVGKQPLIIDFDLAIVGPAVYEELMFVQRVLPMVRYNWQQLLRELPELQKLADFTAYLKFPNEVLREWCYFAASDDAQRAKLYFYISKLTVEAKYYRSSFLDQLQKT